MTTPEDTRPGRHNTGDGAPTDAELINYLADVDRSVSLTQLTDRLGVTREQLKARIESLEERGLIIVSIGLYHVGVRLVEGVQPIADGGGLELVDDVAGGLDVTPADVYTALSNERRRETIRVLARQSRQDDSEETYVAVSSLSEAVCASGEDFSSADDLTPNNKHATYVTLTQTHLPLLDDLDVVEYYSRVQKVRPTDAILVLDAVLDMVAIVVGGDDVGQ